MEEALGEERGLGTGGLHQETPASAISLEAGGTGEGKGEREREGEREGGRGVRAHPRVDENLPPGAAVASSALVLDVNVVSEREILSDIENFANEYGAEAEYGAESEAGGGGAEGSKKTAPVQYDASIDDMISELGIQV